MIRFGPTYETTRDGHDVTYHVNNTNKYNRHFQAIVEEICQADR